MSIYIEEEKDKNGGIFGFALLIVILLIIGATVYYIFFISPDIIESIVPTQFKSIDTLMNLNFNPTDVVNDNFFTGLKQFVINHDLLPSGNSSPFGVF